MRTISILCVWEVADKALGVLARAEAAEISRLRSDILNAVGITLDETARVKT